MRVMAIAPVLVFVACSCAGPRSSERMIASDAVTSLIEAERSFAMSAAAKGTREAFLEYLADDAVAFRPGPVKAREWYADHTEVSGFLSWEPAYAEVSVSGDLGYTTGPWEFKEGVEDAGAKSFGRYVTIWERRGDGPWRVVLDIGNVYDRPVKKVSRVESRVASEPRGDVPSGVDVEQEEDVLLETDRAFSEEVAHSGLVATYMAFSTDDVRYFRMGEPPAKGKKKVRKALVDADTTLTWRPMAAKVSESGDLGYTYGIAESGLIGSSGAAETSSYLRIWRIGPGRRWSVSLDIALPSGLAPGERLEQPRQGGD